MHLLKDVLAPSELVVGWRKVGMSWIKEKGEATSKTLESTSPKLPSLLGFAPPLGEESSKLKKLSELETYDLSLLPNGLPSHPTLFWQLSFIFLIAEFFNTSFFLRFLGF